MTYGDAATPVRWEQATIDRSPRGILLWAVYKAVDFHGNSIHFEYMTPAGSGRELVPQRILYTTHETQIVTTHAIEFAYEGRPDRTPPPSPFDLRLQSVVVRATNGLLRKYLLGYEQGPISQRSRLVTVRVVGADGDTSLPPLTFTYQDGRALGHATFQRMQGPGPRTASVERSGHGDFVVGDFNGDGRQDVAFVYQGIEGREINYSLSTDSGFTPPVQLVNTVGSLQLLGRWQVLVGDVNGDGKDDLVLVHFGRKKIGTQIAFGTVDGLGPIVDSGNTVSWGPQDEDEESGDICGGTLSWYCGARLMRTDINGDHRMDLVWVHPEDGAFAYAFGLPTGIGPIVVVRDGGQQSNFPLPPVAAVVGDFNGDSRLDIASIFPNGASTYALGTFSNYGPMSAMTATIPAAAGAVNPDPGVGVADLNGDHRHDLIFPLSPSEIGVLYGSSGVTTGGPSQSLVREGLLWLGPAGPRDIRRYRTSSADFDGDGTLDALVTSLIDVGADYEWAPTLFAGSPWGPVIAQQAPFTIANDWILAADVNGDGRAELLWFDRTNTQYLTIYASNGNALGFSLPTPLNTPEPGDSTMLSGMWTADFNGDGIDDLFLVPYANADDPRWYVLLSDGKKADLLVGVKNGIGGSLTFEHTPAASVHNAVRPDLTTCGVADGATAAADTCGNANSFPRMLVTRMEKSNGRGQIRSTRYAYFNGRFRPDNRFDDNDLGFEKFERIDEQTGADDLIWMRQDRPFQMRVKQRVVSSSKGFARQEWITYSNDAPYEFGSRLVRPLTHLVQYFDADVFVRETRESYVYGAYGSIAAKTACEGMSCITTRTAFTHDVGRWILGRVDATRTAVGDGTAANEMRLDAERFTYAQNGFDYIHRDRLLCDDARACVCPRDQDCPATVGRWVPVEQSRQFDVFGNVIARRDARGNITAMKWDPDSGQLASMTRFLWKGTVLASLTTSRTYEFGGRLETETDANKQVTKYAYDVLGRPLRIDRPTGEVNQYSYGSFGDPNAQYVYETREGAGTPLWKLRYFDGDGVVYRLDRPGTVSQVVVKQRIDTFVQGVRVIKYTQPYFADQTPLWYEVTYDARNRPAAVDRVNGATRTRLETYAYAPRVTSVTDAANNTVIYVYGDRGELVQRVDFAGITTYAYDERKRVQAVRLVTGATTTYGYDSWGRKRLERDASSGARRAVYDDVGNVLSTTDAESKTVTYTYDELNRVLTKRTPHGGTIVFAYDGSALFFTLGRLARVYDAGGSVDFVYDAGGHVAVRTARIAGHAGPFVTHYAFDALGRLSLKRFPDGVAVKYVWDAAGHLSQVTSEAGQSIATYDAYDALDHVGRRQTSAALTTYAYWPHGPLMDVVSTSASGQELKRLHYDLDPLDDVLAITDQRGVKTAGGVNTDATQSFGRDGAQRLRHAVGAYGSRADDYDGAGNFQQFANAHVAWSKTSFKMSPPNAGLVSAAYGRAGNLAIKKNTSGTYTYGYDDFNRMTWIGRNGTRVIDLAYDYAGVRSRKTDHRNGETTYYADGYEVREKKPGIYAATKYIEAPGLGLVATDTTGSLAGQPTSAVMAAAEGKPLSGSTTHGLVSGAFYHLSDHLRSTSIVLDARGREVSRLLYEPFGMLARKNSVGFDATTRKFDGGEYDEESALLYLGARFYDPEVGRFTTADTVTPGRGTRPLGFNRYAFAYVNPTRWRDTSGHIPEAPNPRDFGWRNYLQWEFAPDYLTYNISFGPVGTALVFDRFGHVY